MFSNTDDLSEIIPGELTKYNTLAKQLKIVKQDGYNIQFIRNPSEDVQLAAVSHYRPAIRYLESPSETVQLAAVQNHGGAIYYILAKGIVPSIVVQRAAVLNDPTWALDAMIKYNFPISKMIQWTAAKRIKELDLFNHIAYEQIIDRLEPDVQEYLTSDKL